MAFSSDRAIRHFIAFLVVILSATTSQACANPVISSTFIQLDKKKSSLTKSDWLRLFRSFHELGIKEIVLQWTATNQAPFFKPYKRSDANVTITDLLDIAEKNQLQLKIGLLHDPEFWVRILERPKSLKIYFARLTHDSLKLAKELFQKVRLHSAFSGWYLPQEIDDVNWIRPERKKVLCLFLREITCKLRELSPEAGIAISAFSNCKLSPLGTALLWEQILSTSHIDSIYFQDGIGTKKQDFYTIPLYLKTMSDLARKNRISFIPVVEIFELSTTKDDMHILPPNSLNRIIEQINLASKYSTKISSFGLLECIMSKSKCFKELLNQYERTKRHKRLY